MTDMSSYSMDSSASDTRTKGQVSGGKWTGEGRGGRRERREEGRMSNEQG